MPSWNGHCGFNHETKLDYDDCPDEVKFRVQQIEMHAGIGTHLDTPAHCIQEGTTAESIPLESLVVPAVCVDVSAKMSPDYIVSLADVKAFEAQYGEVPAGSFVVIYTGWSQYWEISDKYHNAHRFPSVSKEVAEYLVDQNIVGLGVDTLSPDVPSAGFPVHQVILGSGRYIVENIAHADRLPACGSTVVILPLKGAGLTESAVRMIALIER